MSYNKWNHNRGPYGYQQPQRQKGGQLQRTGGRGQFPPTGLKFSSGHAGAGLLGAAPVSLMSPRADQRQHQVPVRRGGGPRPGRYGDNRSPRHGRNRDDNSRKKRKLSPFEKSPSFYQKNASAEKTDKPRPAVRYMVKYVRKPLTKKSSDVLDLKGMYSNMYIPSDFFNADFEWQNTFTILRPHFQRKCLFHVLPKDVQIADRAESLLSPPDADHTWVAKVMLLHTPSKDEAYKLCCQMSDEKTGHDRPGHYQHQTRLYKFLIGSKGKRDIMAIGGSWSESLDGPNPESNPRTLVNTAIRTCKALTGIDLSKCTNWRRMVEIQYHRDEEVRKGLTVPDRVETTVIFVPDVHSCMPTDTEYDQLRKQYLDKCEAVITAAEQERKKKSEPDPAPEPQTPDKSTSDVGAEEGTPAAESGSEDKKASDEAMEVTEAVDADSKPPELDVKSLKVQELRKELDARGLSSRGLKSALIARLTEALEAEAKSAEEEKAKKLEEEQETKEAAVETKEEAAVKTEDNQESSNNDENSGFVTKDEVSCDDKNESKTGDEAAEKKEKAADEKEEEPKIDKEKMRKRWTLPETRPKIPVHPNPDYKKGVFDCSLMSLSTLLEYRHEDNKESVFEVSLFAEAFNQMLQRDHALNIYKALCNPVPEIKPEEDKKEEEENGAADDEEAEPKAKKSKSDSEEKDGESADEKLETVEKEANGDENNSEKDADTANDTDAKSQEPTTKEDTEKAVVKAVVQPAKPEEKVTLRKDLLLSFVFFDTTQCGYIKATDMSDILHSIGLGLSRSQIAKVMANFLERDELKYRQLTDFPRSLVEQYKNLIENSPSVDMDALVASNKAMMQTTASNGVGCIADKSGDVITFNGAVVDVKALQDKLTSSEFAMDDMETTIYNLKSDLASTTKELEKKKADHATLESNHENVKNKLAETEENLKSTSSVMSKYEKALKHVGRCVGDALPKEEKTSHE